MAKPPGTRRVLSLFLTVLGLAGFGALLILMFGRVTLREFAPSSFKRRSFVYYQIPLLKQQITPTVRTDDSTSMDRYLRGANLIKVLPNPNARWDIVSVDSELGAAGILTKHLELDEGPTLEDWSKDHPELAKCLWPAIQEAAQLYAYELTPELFERAMSATDPQLFCIQLNEWLATAYDELAADYRQSSDPQRAVALEKAARVRRESPPPEAEKKADTPAGTSDSSSDSAKAGEDSKTEPPREQK